MFKSALTFFLIYLSWSISFSQNAVSKPTLGILPFKYDDSQCSEAARLAENLTYETFVNSGRLNIVEREFFSELENEKWRQSSDDFLNGEVISKTKSRGAQYLLIGQVTRCQTERKYSETSGSYYFTADLTVSIRITDVESTSVIISDNWDNSGIGSISLDGLFNNADTPEEAMANEAKRLGKEMEKFLEKYYPLEGRILQRLTGLQSKEGDLVISLGTEHGIREKDRLIVYHKSIVADRSYNRDIGELKVNAVNGRDISTAEIRKGEEDIYQLLNQGETLYVRSK